MGKRAASFKYAWVLAGACVPLASLALATDTAPGTGAASAGAQKTFTDMVNSRCEKCHNADDWAGSLAMDTLDLNHVGQNPEVWEKAIAKLGSRLMPPAGAPQPAQADVDAVVDYLQVSVDAAAKDGHVGHVPIQRLSRAEFAANRQLRLCYPSSVVKRDANRSMVIHTLRRMAGGALVALRKPSPGAGQSRR